MARALGSVRDRDTVKLQAFAPVPTAYHQKRLIVRGDRAKAAYPG